MRSPCARSPHFTTPRVQRQDPRHGLGKRAAGDHQLGRDNLNGGRQVRAEFHLHFLDLFVVAHEHRRNRVQTRLEWRLGRDMHGPFLAFLHGLQPEREGTGRRFVGHAHRQGIIGEVGDAHGSG